MSQKILRGVAGIKSILWILAILRGVYGVKGPVFYHISLYSNYYSQLVHNNTDDELALPILYEIYTSFSFCRLHHEL